MSNIEQEMEAKLKRSSVVAALALTVLTVSVFVAAQNKGPASTVSRFLQALADRDSEVLQRTLEPPYDDAATSALTREVVNVLERSSKVTRGKVQQNGRAALVEVTFVMGNGQLASVRFILTKRRSSSLWRIDPRATVLGNTQVRQVGV